MLQKLVAETKKKNIKKRGNNFILQFSLFKMRKKYLLILFIILLINTSY